MTQPAAQEADFEARVFRTGRRLMAEMRQAGKGRRSGSQWLDRMLERVMQDERFRIQALRFVDVLPAIRDEGELVRHMQEYFADDDLPLTGLVTWGVRHARVGMTDRLIARAIRRVMESLARRFLGGADMHEALETAAALRERGIAFSLDRLGEAVVSEHEAADYHADWARLITDLVPHVAAWDDVALLDTAGGRRIPRLDISIKVSSLYSQCNPADPRGSIEGIAARLRPLLELARDNFVSVCLDMEQYDMKHLVFGAFRRLLMEPGLRDWPHAAIAVQAYLTDTEDDLRALIAWAGERGAPITVRLVRGAYWDYETVVARQQGWPEPVWDRKWKTDACYERCLQTLFAHRDVTVPAVATHNVRSIAVAMELAAGHGAGAGEFEFQLLHGMAPDLEQVIAGQGHRLRVYVPYGEPIPGMAYLVRRLLENASSQSFQRMGLQAHLSDDQMLASPTGGLAPGAEPDGDGGAARGGGFRNEPLRRFCGRDERTRFAAAIGRVRDTLGQDWPLRIGDRQRDGGRPIVSLNPARPEQVIGRVATAGTAEADAALELAGRVLEDWRARTFDARAAVMEQVARRLREQRDEFAALQILEAGKNWREADADVVEAIDFLNYYADQARRFDRDLPLHRAGETNHVFCRARGVGVVIAPWNFPLAILCGMTCAAVVTGNTVVVKPSSQTPVIAMRFQRLLDEAGLPPGVVTMLPGAGELVGEYLAMHPLTRFVAFTGSRRVGMRIARLAAEVRPGQRHVRHVIAEMGGKNAIIVDSDADPDDAIKGVLESAFGFQGQKCSAASRVIVVGDQYQEFVDRLAHAAGCLRVGPPEDPGVFMGPVISAGAFRRIRRAIREGERSGRKVLETDTTFLQPGYFIGPVIFQDVDPVSPLGQDEIFGPVLSAMRAESFEQAVELANGTSYALTGGLYSRSPARLRRARDAIQVGNLYLNRRITGAVVGHQPFGGFRLSGLGSRAGGPDYLREFMDVRTVTENTLRRGFAPSDGFDDGAC